MFGTISGNINATVQLTANGKVKSHNFFYCLSMIWSCACLLSTLVCCAILLLQQHGCVCMWFFNIVHVWEYSTLWLLLWDNYRSCKNFSPMLMFLPMFLHESTCFYLAPLMAGRYQMYLGEVAVLNVWSSGGAYNLLIIPCRRKVCYPISCPNCQLLVSFVGI